MHFDYNDGNPPGFDWAYGAVSCRTLATAARHLTVHNPDSFEYFAEFMAYGICVPLSLKI